MPSLSEIFAAPPKANKSIAIADIFGQSQYASAYQEIGARVDPADYGPMKDVLNQDEFGNVSVDPAQYEKLDTASRRAVAERVVQANDGAGGLQQGYDKLFQDAKNPDSPDNFMYGKVADQASTRASLQAISGLGQQLKETYQRFTGDSEGANATNRAGQALRGSLDTLGGSPMERNVRGAAESTLKGLYAARGGGLGGVIYQAAQDSYNNAKTQAIDSGMPEGEATKYALGQGAIEGGVTALFQIMGFGGTEKLLSGNAKWQGVKTFVKGLFGELGEEQSIAFSQMALEKLADVDPTELTPEQALRVASDTTMQTALGFGFAQGISSVTEAVNNPSRRNFMKAGIYEKKATPDGSLVRVVPRTKQRQRMAQLAKEDAKSIITTLSVTTSGADQQTPTSPQPQGTTDEQVQTEGRPEGQVDPPPVEPAGEAQPNPAGPTLPPEPMQMASGVPIAKATANWIKSNFLSGGLQTEDVRKLVYRRDSIVRGHMADLAQNNRDLMREARKAFGKIDDNVAKQLDDALKDPAVAAALPPDVGVVVQKMRDHIDGLSDQIQALGDTSQDLFLTIDKNKGVYVTRTYRKFKSPDGWRDKALRDPQIMGDFAAEVRQSSPQATEEEILQLAEILLRRKTVSNADLKPTGARTTNYVNILKKRKDLSKAVRQLYGEQLNAFENYADTIGQMSSLVANKAFVENLRADGLAKGYFSDESQPQPGHVQGVAADQHRQLEGLRGLVMEPELASAINDLYSMEAVSAPWRALASGSSLTKAMKTVWSFPKSWIRNFLGNPAISVANGHWSFDALKDFGTAGKVTFYDDLFNQSSPAGKAAVRRLKELGVIEGVHLEALKDAAAHASIVAQTFVGNIDPASTVKRAASGAGRGYQAMDTIWKIHNYLGELRVLQEAFPGMGQTDLEERAARTVRAITPTYSEASKAAKFWSRYVPVGPFSMFSAEIIRTTGNRAKLIADEWTSGNPVLKRQAAKRAAGQAAALTMAFAAAEMAKQALGITDDQEDAMRDRVAPWQRNSQLLISSTDSNGMPKDFYDLGFNDPFGIITKPAMAIVRGKPGEAQQELLAPFTSEDLFVGTLVSLARNSDENGRPVWDVGLSPEQQNRQIMQFVKKRLEPGIVTSVGRAIDAAQGKTTRSGQELSLGNEMASNFLGTRKQVFDREVADYYRNNEFNKRIQASGSAIRRAFLQKGTVDIGELESIYRDADSTRRKAMQEWRKYIDGSVLLGETNPYAKVVRDVGSESDIVKAMYSKRYTPYMLRPVDLRQMAKLPDGPARIELWRKLTAETMQAN